MNKAAGVLAILAFGGLAAFFYLTEARPLPPSAIAAHTPDLANGKRLFTIGGCISCHKPPAGAAADRALPSGGHALVTPVGAFYPPNITPDAVTGIGTWSDVDFVNAMQLGLAPGGRHLLPAFPIPPMPA
jgi:mono/diheme cytochrome c family protein